MSTVLLPRPTGPDSDAGLLERNGVSVIVDPYIVTSMRVGEAADADRIRLASRLPEAALVLTSVRALLAFIDHCSVPRSSIVYAIGSASATAAREAGFTDVRVSRVASHNDALVRRVASDMPRAVVLPRSSVAPSTLAAGLREIGIIVHTAVLYDTEPVPLPPPSTLALRAGAIDAVIVRSGSAARALAAFVPDWPVNTRIVAAGRPTATVLVELGLPVDAVSARPDAETVVATTLSMLGIGESHD